MKKAVVVKIIGKKYSWQKDSENSDWIDENVGGFFNAILKDGKYLVETENKKILINRDQAIAISGE